MFGKDLDGKGHALRTTLHLHHYPGKHLYTAISSLGFPSPYEQWREEQTCRHLPA